jgi:hypothetical protein
MTMRELMNMKKSDEKDQVISAVVLKVMEKAEDDASRGIVNCYNPNNIFLKNLNSRNLSTFSVSFGAPITNKRSRIDGLYLAPEVIKGENMTIKSILFSLAIIWDELLHYSNFYKNISEIENPTCNLSIMQTSIKSGTPR